MYITGFACLKMLGNLVSNPRLIYVILIVITGSGVCSDQKYFENGTIEIKGSLSCNLNCFIVFHNVRYKTIKSHVSFYMSHLYSS